MKRVLIIESQMNQYRVPFYLKLNEALLQQGIRLRVAYSEPPTTEAMKGNTHDLPGSVGWKVRGYWFWRNKLLFQPLLWEARASDLVVIEQANKFVLNHLLLAMSRLSQQNVAFWGHGEVRDAAQSRFSQWYRRRTINWVNAWFAYSQSTSDYLVRCGVANERITVVQNSIDTTELSQQIARITPVELDAARATLNIPDNARVAIHCGSLHQGKKLPFLLESAYLIHRALPNFHLVVVGAGPERECLDRAAKHNSWLHLVGPRFGQEKALFLRLAEVALHPGNMGLSILDGFAAGLPVMTTQLPTHGPEIDYLEDGINGRITRHTPEEFASTVISLLFDLGSLAALRAGSLASAQKYSLEVMVNNFRDGICKCLGGLESKNRERVKRGEFASRTEG